MNVLDKISLYGMAPVYSQRGKDKKALEKSLNMRLHPKRRARRRDSSASTKPWQGQKTSADVGQHGQVVILRKKDSQSEPFFEKTAP